MQDPDLIIYGGAFDPPHQGHIDCVHAALERFPNSTVWIMPAAQPAGASGKHKNTAVSFEHRLRLCELAFGPLIEKNPQVSISSIERDLPPPNFTIRTLAWTKATSGFSSFALLMGQDQLASFDRWRAPEEILQTASIIAVSRRGSSPDAPNSPDGKESAKDTAARVLSKLSLSADWNEGAGSWALADKGTSLFLIEKDISKAESLIIRQQLQADAVISEEWIPRRVLEYIVTNQLFKESIS